MSPINSLVEALSFSRRVDLNLSNGWLSAGLVLLFAPTSTLAGQSLAHRINAAGPAQSEKLSDTQPAGRDGVVAGLVIYRGEVPKSPVADELGVARQLLHVDPLSGGLQYVALWLDPDQAELRKTSPAPPMPNRGVSPMRVDQEDYDFVPRMIAIRSGQSVTFTSSDTANHNVHASSTWPTNEFNVFTGSGQPYTHGFTADPTHQPVRLDCDLHAWMRGWIYVFDHPFFAVSDAQGRFRISGVPPGRHVLRIRQPDIGYAVEEDITVKAGDVTQVEIQVSAPHR